MRAEAVESHDAPVLADGAVTLRPHIREDLDRMVELAADQEMLRWTPIPAPYGRSAAERFAFDYAPRCWVDGTRMVWAVEFAGRFVGTVDITGEGVLTHLSFDLHPDARGWGVMTRAVALALDHAFGEGGKQVVRWTSRAGNIDSLRVAHACGFRLDAAIPDGVELRGETHEAWVGSIRAGDPRTPRTTWHATTFETERFRLRPLLATDDERIRETLDDPVSRRYLFERPSPLTLAEASGERIRKWWTAARGDTCTWAVAGLDDDLYLGDITLLGIDEVTGAEAGFYTHPDARGSGVLGETFPAAVRHAFDVLGLRRLTLFAADSNKGSKALAESAGLRWFGTQPLAARSDGVLEDLVGYQLLREDA
ncbi:GNAT family N-acetyltransferase [Gordonia insulae]|uniref:Ribosomal N-acetyltransferase YdaF n=1 Tax=Gordonia insulae TaxID=2420509 RepID=A0A3G8JUB4_9ACTN|nr:GNAT family N-acetyltransferase [Gordonia insulae]AZG48458.1 Putative ribosomal N-acetyltransferase YdaF [Gordonia insulae]